MADDHDRQSTEVESVPPVEEAPVEPAPPIESRFLFVDVAAQRAKQLRRGARPKLEELAADAEVPARTDRYVRLERVAMEEVARGLIGYMLPDRGVNPEGHS
jgi:DNA-directed RNA polymerase subunit K/omega